jgi:hypothetical protein
MADRGVDHGTAEPAELGETAAQPKHHAVRGSVAGPEALSQPSLGLVERQRTLEPVPDIASVIESGSRQHPCGTTSRMLTGGRKPFLKAMAFTSFLAGKIQLDYSSFAEPRA